MTMPFLKGHFFLRKTYILHFQKIDYESFPTEKNCGG